MSTQFHLSRFCPSSLPFLHRRLYLSSSLPLSRSPLTSNRSIATTHPIAAVSPTPEPTRSGSQEDEASSEGGPVEIPSTSPSSLMFATTNNPTPLQVSTSVLLTGAISIFLFRSLRRRAKRAKELRVRSSGVKDTKDLKQEALESLKSLTNTSLDPKAQPSPLQSLLGAVAAGAIAVILYKFTITIEAALNRQAISDSFSVRQMTITIRTIVNGLCYLATFVFGLNSVGLFLYSVQLAFGSFMESESNSITSEQTSDSLLNTSAKTGDSTTFYGTDETNNTQKSREES